MTTAANIILSGAYTSPEIQSEFGKLPPCFLPIGNGRLYEAQVTQIGTYDGKIFLTLPDDFEYSKRDQDYFEQKNVHVIKSPTGLSLTDALAHTLDIVGTNGPVRVLYGDTLVDPKELTSWDQFSVQNSDSFYSWAEVKNNVLVDSSLKETLRLDTGLERQVVCGFFTFSSAELLKDVMCNSANFIDALNNYSQILPLSAVNVDTWSDFGHLSLIYKSRCKLLDSRAFNELQSDGEALSKTSPNKEKISAEIFWYKSMPSRLKHYTPQLLGAIETEEEVSYQLEYLYLPTLAELSVFGELPLYVWRSILDSCRKFLSECYQYRPKQGFEQPIDSFADLFFEKMIKQRSINRVDEFHQQRGWERNYCLRFDGQVLRPLLEIVLDLIAIIPPTRPEDIRFWHGDFFFGNIFYDFRASRIRCIDPRGLIDNSNFSIWGDWRYDLAKLSHSILGHYDAIIRGHAILTHDAKKGLCFDLQIDPQKKQLESLYRKLNFNTLTPERTDIKALTALMFLTMLPLHEEDTVRQDMLLCNGLRLAAEIIEISQ